MNRSHRIWGCALALLSVQGVAVAGVSNEAARDLAKKSGLWGQLESVGSQVRAGMEASAAKNPGKLTIDQRRRLLDCFQTAYAADPLRTTAVDAVAGTLGPTDLPPLLAWYESPTGRKVAAIEEASSALQSDPRERLRLGGDALASASEARKASLQAVVAESRSAEMMADTMIEMTLAIQHGMASADSSTPAVSSADLKADLERRRPQLTARYAQVTLNLYAFTYGGLNEDELKRYADFLGSPSGTTFNDGSARGVSRALKSGAVQLGRCLQEVRSMKGS